VTKKIIQEKVVEHISQNISFLVEQRTHTMFETHRVNPENKSPKNLNLF
jgi:hypothetical protein